MPRFVLTQPLPRVQALAASLRSGGHSVIELPLRRLVPLADQPAVRTTLNNVFVHDWVIFVSPGSVEAAWPSLPPFWPPGTGVATVGPGTEQALRAHGFDAESVPCGMVRPRQAPYDAASLLLEPPFDSPRGLQILVVRGEQGRDDWLDRLRERGARVEVLAVHRSEPVPIDPSSLERASEWLGQAAQTPVRFVFTTQDAIDGLDTLLPRQGREQASAVAVHPRLTEALRKCGWTHARQVEPGEAGMLAGIESVNRP